jgi:molybdopterin converting factor small subunit
MNQGHRIIAINEEYATDEDLIQEGDVVALIPPSQRGGDRLEV